MKSIILFLITVLSITSSAFAYGVYAVDLEKGYAIDGTGQIEEGQRIPPKNSDVHPTPQYTQTIVPFKKYTDINVLGLKRHPYFVPSIPNYNIYYSERRAVPYTKDQYIDVWCTGDKHYKGVDCVSGDYAITFVRARNWSAGTMKAVYKAKKAHKTTVLFLMVDDICLDGTYIQEAKAWAKLWDTLIVFGTIDAWIPWDWVS